MTERLSLPWTRSYAVALHRLCDFDWHAIHVDSLEYASRTVMRVYPATPFSGVTVVISGMPQRLRDEPAMKALIDA